jgi:hypothetical protein
VRPALSTAAGRISLSTSRFSVDVKAPQLVLASTGSRSRNDGSTAILGIPCALHGEMPSPGGLSQCSTSLSASSSAPGPFDGACEPTVETRCGRGRPKKERQSGGVDLEGRLRREVH